MRRKEWFGEWFDSPYYHKLYKHRDKEEARYFIDNLFSFLHPDHNDLILDLACGKGRHAIYINQKGYHVIGLDLSAQNIKYARQYQTDTLEFFEHDMREVFHFEGFNLILNLFTSFGYFDTEEEHFNTIKAISDSLKPGGKFVIDFLNPFVVINNLVKEEIKRIDGIEYHINRYFEKPFIIKEIELFEGEHRFSFHEKVRAIRKDEFCQYFEKTGLNIEYIFGSYELDDYNPESSERLIFIVRK